MSLVQLLVVVVIQIMKGLVQFRHSSLNVGSVASLLHQISVL